MNYRTYRPIRARAAGLCALLLFATFGPAGKAPAAVRTVGSVSSVSLAQLTASANRSAIFSISTGGQLEVTPYAPDVVRVRFHWTGLWTKDEIALAKTLEQWTDPGATFADLGGTFRIETAQLVVEVVKSPSVQVHFKDKSGNYLLRDERMEYDADYNPLSDSSYFNMIDTGALPQGFKLKAVKVMPAGEAYFGLGEYAGPMNRRGRNIQGWNSDKYGWQEGRSPLYMTLPMVYGTQGQTAQRAAYSYGLFFNNPARPVFRMGTQWADKYSFEAADGQLDYFFFSGGANHDMKTVLSRYSELTGRPAMLPKWAFGHHQSRWTYDNQGWVQWLADEFKRQDVPLDAIHIDIDYMDTNADGTYVDGTLHQLTFNRNFPDPAAMIRYCEDRGVKLVILTEPWLMTADPKWSEAASQQHFLKRNDGSTLVTPIWFGSCSWLDFSSAQARGWWKDKTQSWLTQYPFAGLWNDLNEPADKDLIPLNGLYWLDGAFGGYNPSDSRKWHLNLKNTYCVREVSLSYETLQERSPDQRPYVLGRGGWPGVQRYCVGWSGDNTASYDHLRHNIGLGVSVMMSGQANFGHDIGGFIGDPDAELLTRWYEWAVLTPFCRNHSKKWDGQREPWRYASPFKDHMRESIKFRYRLMPYLYSLAWQSTVSGIPMNTPAVMHFPADPQTHYQNDNDFMVGDYLLAAPVVEAAKRDRWVRLPGGADWYHWYSGTKYPGGGWVGVSAPLGQVPLFARAGAIIPMGPAMQNVSEARPHALDIHVWPAPNSEFTMYEDAGDGWDYLSGAFARTRMVNQKSGDAWRFVVDARAGTFDVGARSYTVRFHDTDPVAAVERDGRSLGAAASAIGLAALPEGWFYDATGRVLQVKFPDTGLRTEILATASNRLPVQWLGNTYHRPAGNDLDASDDLWIYTESSPTGAAASAIVVFSTNGSTWLAAGMQPGGRAGSNDKWHANLGKFHAGSAVQYAVAAIDGLGVYKWDSRGGQNYRATILSTPALAWIGNTYHWPFNGSIKPTDAVWMNIDSYPRGAATGGLVVYSVNGGPWSSRPLRQGDPVGQNDHWYADLGTFPARSVVRYALALHDAQGQTRWDNNGGRDYYAVVNP